VDSQAIAEWAEQKVAPKSDKPKQKRLTALDIGWLIKAHREGMTQAAIAERLGITQPAVHKWVTQTTDSTDTAKLFLRGSALRMAENIVENGLARDHIQALNGLGVLQESVNTGVTLIINGLTLHGTGRGDGQGEVVDAEPLSPLQLNEAGEGQ